MAKSNKVFGSEQVRFDGFCKELEALSLKYGIFIQSVGGVEIVRQNVAADVSGASVDYIADVTSGDLVYEFSEK